MSVRGETADVQIDDFRADGDGERPTGIVLASRNEV
jgi:predicted RNA-binding protein with TRAM domain